MLCISISIVDAAHEQASTRTPNVIFIWLGGTVQCLAFACIYIQCECLNDGMCSCFSWMWHSVWLGGLGPGAGGRLTEIGINIYELYMRPV